MRIREQLLITTLVVLAMIAGFAARSHVNSKDPEARVLQETEARQLSAYAPNSASDVGGRSDVDLRPLEVFYSALQHVREDYVEPIQKSQEHQLTYGALRAMLDSLRDPETRFLDPEQADLVDEASTGKFQGIGAVLLVKQNKEGTVSEEQVVVASTLPESPARKAGLQNGDVVTEIGGKSVLPYDPFQRVEKMITDTRNGRLSQEKLQSILESENERIKNGESFQKVMDELTSKDTKEVTLTVVRAGAKAPLKIKVQPAETVVQPVTFTKLNPTTGYVRVNLLIPGTDEALSGAISSLKSGGAKQLIVDLRNSPGGTAESAEIVAGELMAEKTFSLLQLPKGKQRTVKASVKSGNARWSGPIAVMVNGGTSGLSEVLAAALHDSAGAALVGSTTFGDNLQQTYVPLKDGSAVTMTTGKYLTPKGVDYRGKGLVPDIQAASASAEAAPSADPVVSKAIAALAAGKAKG